MRRLILIAALAVAAPALAQSSLKPPASSDGTQPRQKFVTIFGNDACPKSTDPDEIIICTKRPDEERYRIPPGVRAEGVKPGSARNSELVRGSAAGGAGGSIGSCTPVGPGGGTGCNQQMQDAYRAEKKAARGEPQ